METTTEPSRQRKSLAVDQKTYDMLQEICFEERRTRIEQLKILIENEHAKLFGES
jgi:hypothetical protein|tara:strand:- start:609 stop:773 length:165 start_codon:yes stop_codon:yes gene_type:complete